MKLNATDFPLILAGPILRQVTSHSVSVFLALRECRWVQLKLYDHPHAYSNGSFDEQKVPIEWHSGFKYALQPTICLGEHLYVVVATVKIPETYQSQSIQGLQPDQLYGYNVFFYSEPVDTSDRFSLVQAGFDLSTNNPQPLGFEHEWLPSFSLLPDNLSGINIIHGSCRKPHGEGTDMLARLDDYLGHLDRYKDLNARPHLLLLTGDQIYADDVDPVLLWLLHHASRALLGWKEVFPGTGPGTGTLSANIDKLIEDVTTIATATIGETLSALPGLNDPDLYKTINEAIDDIQFSENWAKNQLIQSLLQRGLSRFREEAAETLGTAGAQAGQLITEALIALAKRIKEWLNRHTEIFSDLCSHQFWGQAGIPKTDANKSYIDALRIQLAYFTIVDNQTAVDVAGQLANNLDPDTDPTISGHYFKDRLAHYFNRADVLFNNPDATAVNSLVQELKTWLKEDPEDPDRVFNYIASRVSPPQRAKELKQFAALTSDAMTAHLMFLGEFYMMYLYSWSDSMWLRDGEGNVQLPEFYEVVPNYSLMGPLGKAGLEEAREGITSFVDSLKKVRRVLANVPTLMIFDDHEVTDDWNLNQDWVHSVNISAMGPQLLRNALAAYAIFQDWGNQPENYLDDDNLAGRRILKALSMPDSAAEIMPPPMVAQNDPDDTRSKINKLFGVGPEVAAQLPKVTKDSIPTALIRTTLGDYAIVKSDGRKRWDWDYQPYAGSPIKIIALDTRNHRGFPTELWAANLEVPIAQKFDDINGQGYVAAANLIHPDQLPEQLSKRMTDDLLYLVISPAPVFGLPLVEDLFQRLQALSSGPEVADFEAWQGNPDGFERFLAEISGKQLLLLSGDVHYAYSNILSFKADNGTPISPPIMQLTSSSMKNETGLTRFLAHVGHEGSLVDWLDVSSWPDTYDLFVGTLENMNLGLNEAIASLVNNLSNIVVWFDETAPMVYPLDPGSWVTYYLSLKDTLLLDFNMLTPRGMYAIGRSAISYTWDHILFGSGGGQYTHGNYSLQFLADDREISLREERTGLLNDMDNTPDDLGTRLMQQEEVVGYNNFGQITFAFDDTNSLTPIERVTHELFWRTHDRRGRTTNKDLLTSTIHGFLPRTESFRRAIVRVAREEHKRWNPANGPLITEDDPQGESFIDQYHAALKIKNDDLRAIATLDPKKRILFHQARGGDGSILHWSATFISYVMLRAGARERFFYSPRHIDYMRRAKANYKAIPPLPNSFHFIEIDHVDAVPKMGDLIANWRATQFTYGQVETTDLYDQRPAHVDVVVAVSGDNDKVQVIGGNVGGTVAEKEITLVNGKLSTAAAYVGIIRFVGTP